MPAHYSLFKNPAGKDNDRETTLHARLVNQRMIDTETLISLISEATSFTSADVKGVLEVLKKQLAFHLKLGSIVEIEGIGTFSVSVKCPPLTEEKAIKPKLVEFNKVVFRCSKELRNSLKQMKVERADEKSRINGLTSEERKANILNYLERNATLSSSSCCGLNSCSKYMALKDLNELLEEGRITRLGARSNAQYALAEG